MTDAPILDRVKGAIDALDSPQHCHEASAWLVAFQATAEAWDVAQQLLMEPTSTNKRFHGANMFYHKIMHDYPQLGDRAPLLKQTLISHLLSLASESHSDVPVYRRICLSLAALVLQMNEAGVVSDMLIKLNAIVANAPRLLLELLTVLPEECYNRHIIVAQRTRHQFSDQLCRSANEVFQFLHQLAASSCANQLTAQSIQTQKQILVCLEKWIDNADIPLNAVLLPSGIFAYALDALSQEHLLEEASCVAIVVMRRYPYTPHSRDTKLISAILPRVMAVRSLWAHEMAQSSGPNVDICRSISRLFTETMESYIELYLSSTDYGQQHILMQLLDCSRFTEDFDVTRIPLRAFYELANSLKELRHEMGHAEYSDLRDSVAPYFLQLLEVAVKQLKMDDSVLRGDDQPDADELAERDEWKETVLDVCDVVGVLPCMEGICSIVQAELNIARGEVSWSAIEACLYGIHIIGNQLPSNENTFVPNILQLCSSCPQILGLHVSIVQFLGSIAHWINANRTSLPAIFEQLLNSLATPALSLPASAALLKLCKHCGRKETFPVEQQLPLDKLFQSLLYMRTSGNLSLEADTTVLEGLTYIVSDLPPTEAVEALKSVTQPTAETLSANLLKVAPIQATMADIERVTVLFRYTIVRRDLYADTHPVAAVFLLVWPLLLQAMKIYSTETCFEKVCRCYKYVIKSSGRYFLPHLNAMAEHIVQEFNQHPIASFLYVAAVCFGEFGALISPYGGPNSPVGVSGSSPMPRDSSGGDSSLRAEEATVMQTCLSNIYIYLSKIFFEKFRTVDDFSRTPDVCEEYFFLSAKVFQYLPEVLLGADSETNQRLQTVVQAGLSGLKVHHRETVKGILTMFGEIINILYVSKRPDVSTREKAVFTIASTVMSACAGVLVNTLFNLISDPGSSSIVEACLDNVVALLWCLTEISPDDMKVSRFLPLIFSVYYFTICIVISVMGA